MYIIRVVVEYDYFIEHEHWYQRIILPIRVELYTKERPTAQAQLAAARTELDRLGLDSETQQIADYSLCWYEFVLNVQGRSRDECRVAYQQVLPHFNELGLTPTSDNQRRRLKAILRCNGSLYGCQELDKAELDKLLEDLPGRDKDEFLWHNIAGWAFAQRDLHSLERAYQVLLTQSSQMLGRAKWQRVNFMMRLLNGRANSLDVEQTIRGMEVLPQLIEFEQLIWPVCGEMKLVDASLAELLGTARRGILANPPVPGLEPRSRYISI